MVILGEGGNAATAGGGYGGGRELRAWYERIVAGS
jgi:hypothetical protein